MDLSKVIKSETIKLDMEATTKEDVIKELTELLYKVNAISNKESFLKDVFYRESIGTTGIGNGIAIPHGKSKSVNKTSLAIGRTKSDIEWESLDEQPVRFIILFAVTEEDKNSTHIKILAKVASNLGDDDVCANLLKAKSPEEILDIFSGSN
jgi:fructose-specific phosphotransferase system IIA component